MEDVTQRPLVLFCCMAACFAAIFSAMVMRFLGAGGGGGGGAASSSSGASSGGTSSSPSAAVLFLREAMMSASDSALPSTCMYSASSSCTFFVGPLDPFDLLLLDGAL